MKRKCDECGRPATHHSVEIVKGEKIETHLCDAHAAESGMNEPTTGHTPIDELLTSFVKVHSTGQTKTVGKAPTKVCSNCGLTFAEFREKSLLGCPTCYADFEAQLGTLLERAHEGGTHHVGKTPRRAGGAEQRQLRLARLPAPARRGAGGGGLRVGRGDPRRARGRRGGGRRGRRKGRA